MSVKERKGGTTVESKKGNGRWRLPVLTSSSECRGKHSALLKSNNIDVKIV